MPTSRAVDTDHVGQTVIAVEQSILREAELLLC
jgi:hypothetical protein